MHKKWTFVGKDFSGFSWSKWKRFTLSLGSVYTHSVALTAVQVNECNVACSTQHCMFTEDVVKMIWIIKSTIVVFLTHMLECAYQHVLHSLAHWQLLWTLDTHAKCWVLSSPLWPALSLRKWMDIHKHIAKCSCTWSCHSMHPVNKNIHLHSGMSCYQWQTQSLVGFVPWCMGSGLKDHPQNTVAFKHVSYKLHNLCEI